MELVGTKGILVSRSNKIRLVNSLCLTTREYDHFTLKQVLFVNMPVLHLFAIQHSGERDPKIYYCPVYKKPKRTDLTYITTVLLKTAVQPDHWTLRGVALLCDVK